MAAPTLTAASTSNIGTGTRTTGSVSWSSGDFIVVLGMTADNGHDLNTPTTAGTGVTMAGVPSTPTNDASSCRGYAWTATASASSSGTFQATAGEGTDVGLIVVLVYSGSDGLGNTAISAALGATTTQNLTRAGDNSAVCQIWGDWNAVNDTTVSWTPAGFTQQEAEFSSGNYTGFAASWTDQGAAGGPTAYGFSGFAGGDLTAITIEVLGTEGGEPPVVIPPQRLPLLGAG